MDSWDVGVDIKDLTGFGTVLSIVHGLCFSLCWHIFILSSFVRIATCHSSPQFAFFS